VDHEYYVMQSEIYTLGGYGQIGNQIFDAQKILAETPDYFVFNGAVGSLSDDHPLKAKTGETIRIFFGDAGPNFISSFHIIGEVMDKVDNLGSLTSAPLADVQTTLVPPGGTAIIELGLEVPGKYLLVDHAISRVERGLVGDLIVEGPDNPDIYRSLPDSSGQ
jgi:nitrite reductase (NO-forming)